jgi:GTP-binding protein
MIRTAVFVKSSGKVEQLPPPDKPEFAFIGRSNVGKSSLINYLTNHKELAHTSSSPGKTQTINHYLINNAWYLVDLPGYGYAKVSQEKRAEWEKTLFKYLNARTNLMCVMVLVDVRIDPQKSDIQFLNKLGEAGLPVVVVFTKADKINKSTLEGNVEKFRTALLEYWEEAPPFFITSAERQIGKEELIPFIEKACKSFVKE